MVLGLSQKEKNAALWAALKGGEDAQIRQALQRGGDPDMKVPEGEVCVLSWAADHHYGSEARTLCMALLDYGANPNTPDSTGQTPLAQACGRSHREIIEKMLEKGGDVLAANKNGTTPLSRAMGEKHWHNVQMMLVPQVLDRMPTPVAGDRDSMQIMGFLRELIDREAPAHILRPVLDRVTDVHVGQGEGFLPALTAVSRDHTAALDLLMARDDFNIDAQMRGRSLLHTAIGNKNGDIARRLLDKGANVMTADGMGRTPLESAAQTGATGMMQTIMRKIREKTGVEELDQDLLDRALLAAAGEGHARCIDILITAGANKNAVNDKGETPLIRAAKGEHMEAVKMLLVKHDADTQIADASGLIAYDHARTAKEKNSKAEMADYLILFQPGYEPPPPPPPPPPPVDHNRYVKMSDFSVDVKEKSLTMTFNFWTQQVIFRDPDVKQGSTMLVMRFDEIPRQESIGEAREMLERLGGKPPAYDGAGAQKPDKKKGGPGGLSKPS